jgi:hypothetical protein
MLGGRSCQEARLVLQLGESRMCHTGRVFAFVNLLVDWAHPYRSSVFLRHGRRHRRNYHQIRWSVLAGFVLVVLGRFGRLDFEHVLVSRAKHQYEGLG